MNSVSSTSQEPAVAQPLSAIPGLSAIEREFCMATADGATDPNEALRILLSNMKMLLKMDIAFVSQFVGGRRVFRHVAGESDKVRAGHSDALEETYCQRIVDGRMPRVIRDTAQNAEAGSLMVTKELDIGAYLSAPVTLQDGQVYGTLCCISHRPRTDLGIREQDALKSVAVLISKQIARES